jgi:hypothetical protein
MGNVFYFNLLLVDQGGIYLIQTILGFGSVAEDKIEFMAGIFTAISTIL